jgi:hypothetical protein
METTGFRFARHRFDFEVSLDLFERRVIVRFGAKWADYIFRDDTPDRCGHIRHGYQ